MDTSTPIPLYTADELAHILGRSQPWVRRQAGAGVIPGRRVGKSWRFTADDVRAYLDGCAPVSAEPPTGAQFTPRRGRRRHTF